MLNSIGKLIAAVLVGLFMVWATYKIGAGLGYWWPFIAVVFGLVMGAVFCIVEKAKKSKSEK